MRYNKYIGFVVNEDFRTLIDDYCTRTKQKLSEYIRNLIRNDLIEKKVLKIETVVISNE